MKYDKNLILDYVYYLSINPYDHFTDEQVDDFLGAIVNNPDTDISWSDFSFEYGATKLVIVPSEENYVIKIPFDGHLDFWGDKDMSQYDDAFCWFCGGGGDWGEDYCDSEVQIYDEIDDRYKEFFVPIEYVGHIYNYPIYVQPWVGSIKNDYSKASLDMIKKSKIYLAVPNAWLASCLDCFNQDMDKLNEFLDYLRDAGFTTDLHSGNVGYYHGHPVILDYAGYSD